jgi:hydroxymethylbilane synthase
MPSLRIATRGSAQARRQSEIAAESLRRATGHDVELVLVKTTGDVRSDVPLHEMGGQGVFVKEVQEAVLDGRADIAVHSAKDLPSSDLAPGLTIAAFCERRSPWDVLVGRSLAELANGATVATGSVRRRAQLRLLRPDLQFAELRGNIHTRLGKVPEGGAIVMAEAALQVLGLEHLVAHRFSLDEMVPQVGQGTVALECRVDDEETAAACGVLDHAATRACVEAERAFLATLGSGCTLPVGAYAVLGTRRRRAVHVRGHMSTSSRRPLVAVPRAAQQASALCERLEAAGFGVLEVPVIEIVDPPDGGAALASALARVGTYAWVVVTSPNGAARVAPALTQLPAGSRPKVAAVGPGTAAALGVNADLVPATNSGEGLVAEFPAGTGTVLVAQAEAARPVVADGIAALGWRVDAVVAYRTVGAAPPAAALDALATADAVVFTSGSTVRHLVAAVGVDQLPRIVISIGPATSAVAASLAVPVTATANDHTLEGAVAALTREFELPPGTRPKGRLR